MIGLTELALILVSLVFIILPLVAELCYEKGLNKGKNDILKDHLKELLLETKNQRLRADRILLHTRVVDDLPRNEQGYTS